MAKSKHTPGPWTVKPRTSTFDIIGADLVQVLSTSWHHSIRRPYPLKGEAAANVRLAAAAPDLLGALKLAQTIIGHPDDDGSKLIAEVIAKAEGRPNG